MNNILFNLPYFNFKSDRFPIIKGFFPGCVLRNVRLSQSQSVVTDSVDRDETVNYFQFCANSAGHMLV